MPILNLKEGFPSSLHTHNFRRQGQSPTLSFTTLENLNPLTKTVYKNSLIRVLLLQASADPPWLWPYLSPSQACTTEDRNMYDQVNSHTTTHRRSRPSLRRNAPKEGRVFGFCRITPVSSRRYSCKAYLSQSRGSMISRATPGVTHQHEELRGLL